MSWPAGSAPSLPLRKRWRTASLQVADRGREFKDGSVSVLILDAAKFCRAVEIACTGENDASHWEVSIAATGKNMQQGFCPASGRLRQPKDRAAAVGAALGRGSIEVSRCIQG